MIRTPTRTQHLVRAMPLLAEEVENGEARMIGQEEDLAYAIWLFSEQRGAPEFVAKLYWPFLMAHVDEGHFALFDLLGLSDGSFQEPELESGELLSESRLKTSLSLEQVDNCVSTLCELSKACGDSHQAVATTIDLPGCARADATSDGLGAFLFSSAVTEAPTEAEILTPRTPFAESVGYAEVLRESWRRTHSLMLKLQKAQAALESQAEEWSNMLSQLRLSTERDAAKRIAPIHDQVERQVRAAESQLEKETKDIELKLAPEICLVEADISKIERQEQLSIAGGQRPQRSLAVARKKAESELKRLRSEHERLITLVTQHHEAVIDREMKTLEAQEELTRSELRRIDAASERIEHSYLDAINALVKLSARVKKVACTVDPYLIGYPESSSRGLRMVDTILLVPIWVCMQSVKSGVTLGFLLPRYIRRKSGVLGAMKQMFGGQSIPLDKTVERFCKHAESLIKASVASDGGFRNEVRAKGNACNVLSDSSFVDSLDRGLDGLMGRGWMGDKNRSAVLSRIEFTNRRS